MQYWATAVWIQLILVRASKAKKLEIPTITARALAPRAEQTFGWFSVSEIAGDTEYAAYTYDQVATNPGLSSTGIYWLDWCGNAWCDYYTTCTSGSAVGPNIAIACDDTVSRKCITEALLRSYGASVPLLRKVGCQTPGWNPRTYFQVQPSSSYDFAQPAIDWVVAMTSAASGPGATASTSVHASSSAGQSATITTSLNLSTISSFSSTATSTPGGDGGARNNNAGIIAGSVIGGTALIGFFVLAALFIMRRNRRHRIDNKATMFTGPTKYKDEPAQHKVSEVNGTPRACEMDSNRGAELQGDSTFTGERPGDSGRY